MSVSTRRPAIATLLTGIIADLVGPACIHLLHWIQAIAWDMYGGAPLEVMSAVSPTRRVGTLTLVGVVGALSWFLLFRRDTTVTSMSGAVGGAPTSPLHATWHALTQVLIVGLGASVGCEVAPREMAAALSAAAAGRLDLTSEDRRIIVACDAGTGLATVYLIPLSDTIYTLEILLVSLSTRAVAPALITSGIAVFVSMGFMRPTFPYMVPALTPSLSLTVFGALIGPVLGTVGRTFREAVTRTGAIRSRDWRILITLPFAFVVVSLVFTRISSVLGNRQASAQTQFDATWAAGVGLAFMLLVLLAKTATMFLTIGTGSWGGVLTPAVVLGTKLGAVVGLPWTAAWPESEIAAFAFIGAAVFLGTSMRAPFTGLILVIEFTGQSVTISVSTVLAISGATTTTIWLSHRTSVGRSAH